MLLYIALFVGLICLAITVARPYLGLLIYICLLYLRPSEVYPALAPYHVVRIQAIVLIISCFILHRKAPGETRNPIPPQTKFFLGLLLFILLSTWNGWWPYTKVRLDLMVKNFIAFLLIVRLVDSETKLRGAIWTLLLLSAILAGYSVQQYLSMPTGEYQIAENSADLLNKGYYRFGGFSGAHFSNAGDFAALINLVVPLAFLSVWAERKTIFKIAALICFFLFVGAVVASGSRGSGVITLAFSMALLLLGGWKSRRNSLKIGSVIIAFVMILGITAFAQNTFWARTTSIMDYENQLTAQLRIQQIKVGAKMMLRYPFFGAGTNMFRERAEEIDPSIGVQEFRPHNMYIEAGAELGIGGLLFIILLFYYSLRDAWQLHILEKSIDPLSWKTLVSLALAISILTFLMAAMFQVVIDSTPPFLIIGLCVAMRHIAKAEESREKELGYEHPRPHRTITLPA